MADLILDLVNVKTDLAEEYIKKYDNFKDWPKSGHYRNVQKYSTKDEYTLESLKLEKNIKEIHGAKVEGVNIAKGLRLAKIIEDNELLFSQLEYLIRKTNATDVRNNIKLISQHLQCYDEFSPRISGISILMNEESPLFVLACVACVLNTRKNDKELNLNVVTTQKMAPLCNLFIELCSNVGWKIPLIFVNDIEEYKKKAQNNSIKFIDGTFKENGCTAIITETADIDSALDYILNSSVTAPWKLHRIFVQESVYDEVKGILAWKCKRELIPSCIDSFAAKGHVFVCDALTTEIPPTNSGRKIPVEAYRTSKEVRTLISQYPTAFLSIWAGDISLSHELAIEVPAARVWINDYGTFDGPPRASLPIFDQIYPEFKILFCSPLTEFTRSWVKLSEQQRVDLILKTLEDHVALVPSSLEFVEKLQDALLNRSNDSFVCINSDKICFGVEQPRSALMIDVDSDKRLYDLFNAVVRGSGVLYSLFDRFVEIEKLFKAFQFAQIPIYPFAVDSELPQQDTEIAVVMKKTKVISTNFGTVFAN